LRHHLIFFALLFTFSVNAQLFDNAKNTSLVKKGVDYVYNMQPDSALIYIDSIESVLPQHPVVPLLRALNVLWSSMPNVTEDSTFAIFTNHLYETVRLAGRIDGERQEHPEAIFFEIAARGLLAEYYADADFFMKAITEAGKAYNLLRPVSQLTAVNPDFYLPIGVYNYFREKYPERHPTYKPLLWFFRSGDVELGISQVKQACEHAILTKVEAYIYLSYIYLRYEELPELAQTYLLDLSKIYPNNHYVVSKYLESLEGGDDFEKAPLFMINQLLSIDQPYYRLAGNSFMGLYAEKVNNDNSEAIRYYNKSISLEKRTQREPDYYLSISHLGLSRIFMKMKNLDKAIYHAREALSYSETKEIEQESKAILYRLE
jgi:tetratricopeptide (TPR) repeat protein